MGHLLGRFPIRQYKEYMLTGAQAHRQHQPTTHNSSGIEKENPNNWTPNTAHIRNISERAAQSPPDYAIIEDVPHKKPPKTATKYARTNKARDNRRPLTPSGDTAAPFSEAGPGRFRFNQATSSATCGDQIYHTEKFW